MNGERAIINQKSRRPRRSVRFILHSMIKSMFKKWTHSEFAVGQKIPARSGGRDSEGVGDERNKVNRRQLVRTVENLSLDDIGVQRCDSWRHMLGYVPVPDSDARKVVKLAAWETPCAASEGYRIRCQRLPAEKLQIVIIMKYGRQKIQLEMESQIMESNVRTKCVKSQAVFAMIPKALCFKVLEGAWVLDHTIQILGEALHSRNTCPDTGVNMLSNPPRVQHSTNMIVSSSDEGERDGVPPPKAGGKSRGREQKCKRRGRRDCCEYCLNRQGDQGEGDSDDGKDKLTAVLDTDDVRMFEDRPIEETEMTIVRGLLQEMCQEVGNMEREYAPTEIGNEKDHVGTMDESSLCWISVIVVYRRRARHLDPVRTPVFAQVRITITENLALVIIGA
ncbi:hypothetical protein M405DRAFT_847812 [Rhizopogon salebrosus TDB-379]|nr:hypothetical protein M405DRAFT_847812 [Rhizopogon salebrosus TDB-379]